MKRFLLISLLLLSLLLMAGGVYLKQGIHLDELKIGPAALVDISLQWQRKLVLEIGALDIALPENKSAKQKLDLSAVDKVVPVVQWLDRLFSRLSVQQVTINDVHATLLYESSRCSLTLTSPFVELEASIRVEDNNSLLITLEDLKSESFTSQASGSFQIDIGKRAGLGELAVNMAGLPVSLAIKVTPDGLSFQGKQTAPITTITPFVDLFGISHNIQRWITEYLTGSRYELKSLRGDFPWNNPLHLLESAYAEVRVHGCEYVFAPGLDAIKSEYTDVEFKKGVLAIFPHKSTFYGQDTGESWLDINFNDIDNILLTAYIKTRAVGNADIMNLLKYYDIPLPFVQTKGVTDTDLTLAINLNKTEVTTKGRFQIDDGVVAFDGHPYEIENAVVTLQNSLVTIDSITVSSGDVFRIGASGFIDTAQKKGDIDILLQAFELSMGASALRLETTGKQPKLQYQIRPDGGTLTASESSWKLDAFTLGLGAFSTPFVFEDYSGTLSRTQFSINSEVAGIKTEAQIQGDFVLKKQKIDLSCLLQKFSGKGIELKSLDLPLSIVYNDGLYLQSQQESEWSLGTIPVTLAPVQGTYKENVVSVSSHKIIISDYVDGMVSGFFNYALAKGEAIVNKPHFRMDVLADFFKSDTILTVQVDASEEFMHIRVPEVDLQINTAENQQWSVELTDLQAAHERSSLLQRLRLDAGQIGISSSKEGSYSFSAEIPWQYPVLVENNEPIEQYMIRGTVSKGRVQAVINEKVTIEYTDADMLQVHSEDIAYNLPAIFKFMKECLPPESKEDTAKKTISSTLIATNSALYLSSSSRIIADNLSFNSHNKKVDLEIRNEKGHITVEMEGDTFSVQGEDLDDKFMNALARDGNLQNGRMTVVVKGNFDEFSAVFDVKDTVLSDFNVFNNVMSLIDTIPALITFSLPGYSSSGLHVSSAMIGMKVKDGVATFESFDVDSAQMTVTGTGWIDFPEKKIEMDMNLTTQSKKNMNKIPLVGYILVGKEKQPSITMKVSGDLMDPEVEHTMFREVVTLPFGILFRTLALPAHLVAPLFSSDDDEEQPEKEE